MVDSVCGEDFGVLRPDILVRPATHYSTHGGEVFFGTLDDLSMVLFGYLLTVVNGPSRGLEAAGSFPHGSCDENDERAQALAA
jgi:hypothetical protein